MNYIGILDGSGMVWGVRVPDVPGCFGGGATPEEAVSSAVTALRELLADYTAAGMALRNPRDMTEVAADTEAMFKPSSEIMVLVPAIIQTDHMIRANISIDAGTLSTIDAGAKRRGLTRSAFLASASLATIEREGR